MTQFSMRLAAIMVWLSVILGSPGWGLTLTASGRFSDQESARSGTWSGRFDVARRHFDGTITLTGVEEVTTDLEITGSFYRREISFGSTRSDGPQISFSGRWSPESGLDGAFTYNGRTGKWSGSWGDVLPGQPAALAEEPTEALPRLPAEPRVQYDPDVPASVCNFLNHRHTMRLISGAGETLLRQQCAEALEARMSRWNSGVGRWLSNLARRIPQFLAFATAEDLLVNDPGTDPYPNVTQSEVSIGVSGLNPNLVVMGFNDSTERNTSSTFTGYARSTSAGDAWTDQGPLLPTGITRVGGDPVVVSDLNGQFHFGSLAIFPGAGPRHIGVTRSTDGGASFGSFVNASPFFQIASADKEEMAVDRSPASTFVGNIYVCWVDFFNGGVRFSRSTNGGTSYQQYTASSGSGYLSDPLHDTEVQGCSIAVGPEGDVYVGWWDDADDVIRVVRSADGGATFPLQGGPGTAVQSVVVGAAIPPADGACCERPAINGNVRVQPHANLAADPLQPNNVYAVWQANVGGSMEVHFSRSTNRAANWTGPVRLNDVATNDQVFPRIATGILYEPNPDRTAVKVIWSDRRLDALNEEIHIFSDTSVDSGATWSTDTRLSDIQSFLPALCPANFDCNTAVCYFGDYNGVASLNPLSSEFVFGWGAAIDFAEDPEADPDCAGFTFSRDPNVYVAAGC